MKTLSPCPSHAHKQANACIHLRLKSTGCNEKELFDNIAVFNNCPAMDTSRHTFEKTCLLHTIHASFFQQVKIK